jgi:glucokinase
MSTVAYLLADIGGTNARFALACVNGECRLTTAIYQVREHPTLLGALKKFLNEYAGNYSIYAAAFAIAGPVLGPSVRLTNSDWVCDRDEIMATVGTERVTIMNDFGAIALAISNLRDQDLSVLQAGDPSSSFPAIVLGPGTGLGMAALAPHEHGGWRSFSTEAGHVRYAPANDREHKIVRLLLRSTNMVTAEHLVSGPGLVNLYRANCILAGRPVKNVKPATIVEMARNDDALCYQVLDDFAAIFGSVASQMALSWLSLGGVYLAGGVLEKLGDLFNIGRFLERFGTNPQMADLLARVPVKKVLTSIPAFSGLLAHLERDYPHNAETQGTCP